MHVVSIAHGCGIFLPFSRTVRVYGNTTREISLLWRSFEYALRSFVSASAPRLPRGPYALVVDGVYFTFERREWVLYLMAMKPIHFHRMYFLDPVLVKGRERLEV